MRILVAATLVALAAFLYLLGNARAAVGPEPHPSCHCKARWDHRPYVYRSTIRVTVDGHSFYVPSRCVVNPRTGDTVCRII